VSTEQLDRSLDAVRDMLALLRSLQRGEHVDRDLLFQKYMELECLQAWSLYLRPPPPNRWSDDLTSDPRPPDRRKATGGQRV